MQKGELLNFIIYNKHQTEAAIRSFVQLAKVGKLTTDLL